MPDPTTPKAPRYAWRRQPDETGLARVTQGPRGAELRHGHTVLLHVAPMGRGRSAGWYWYGLGRNTCQAPCASKEAAQAEAAAWFRETGRALYEAGLARAL